MLTSISVNGGGTFSTSLGDLQAARGAAVYTLIASTGQSGGVGRLDTGPDGPYVLSNGFWFTVPTCPASSTPIAELNGVEFSTKNRFLSFSAGDSGQTQGVRVTFVSLPPPFDLWNGSQLWVGPTSQVSQAGSSVAPLPGFPDFTAARLRCEPLYVDWSSMGTVHVFHEGIVPGGIYSVDVVDESCNADVANSFSQPHPMTTAVWGDTVLNLADTPPLPAEGDVNVVDALAVLARFSSVPTSITKARADLEPGCLDLRINVADVLSSLSGFVGLSYPFLPTAPNACDSKCVNRLP